MACLCCPLVRVLILTQQAWQGTHFTHTTHASSPSHLHPHRVEDDGTTLPSFRGRGLVRGPLRRVCPWGSSAQQRHLRHQHQQTRDDRGTCIDIDASGGSIEEGGERGEGDWGGEGACLACVVYVCMCCLGMQKSDPERPHFHNPIPPLFLLNVPYLFYVKSKTQHPSNQTLPPSFLPHSSLPPSSDGQPPFLPSRPPTHFLPEARQGPPPHPPHHHELPLEQGAACRARWGAFHPCAYGG